MKSSALIKIPMYDHQVEGAKAMLANPQGFCNFAEMGTGKTLMAIAAMNRLRENGQVNKVLVVCPVTLKGVWLNEITDKSALDWNVVVLAGTLKERSKQIEREIARARPNTVIVTNFDSLQKLSNKLSIWRPDLIVADECQAIKNRTAWRSKAIKAIPAKFKWAMTGTPLPQSPLDLWSVFDWVRPGHLGNNFYAFRNRHAIIYNGAGFPMVKGFKNLGPLKTKVDQYSWRKMKIECLELPQKVYQTIDIEMSPDEMEQYKTMAQEMIIEAEGKTVVASTALVKLLRLQQLTSGFVQQGDWTGKPCETQSKLAALEELLEDLEDKKVVVWCRFKQDAANIEALCKHMKRPSFLLTGDTLDKDRTEIVRQFQEVPGNQVLIGNIQVGGFGLTLTAASHCIYFSNSWSWGDRIQSEDRLHRIGQKSSVNYYDLVCVNTIDKYIKRVLTKKEELSNIITGDNLRKVIYGED